MMSQNPMPKITGHPKISISSMPLPCANIELTICLTQSSSRCSIDDGGVEGRRWVAAADRRCTGCDGIAADS
jgi:hypothetical protein